MPLRARSEPDLPGDGNALWHRCVAGAAPQTPGQSESRSRSADCPALDRGRAAPSQVLLAPRTEPGDPRVAGKAEPATLPETRRLAPEFVRGSRSTRAAPAACRALRSLGVVASHGQHRLSHPVRAQLLQGYVML